MSPIEGSKPQPAAAAQDSPRLQTAAALLLVVAITSLAQPTGFRGLDRVTVATLPLSTLQNLLVLAATVIAALVFGVRRRASPVLLATTLLLAIGFMVSSRLEWLTAQQSVRTFLALSMAPFLFEVRLPRRCLATLRRLFPWFAILNLALGLVLWVSVGNPIVRVDHGAVRLAGTVVPAGLAALGLVALMFSLLAARDRPRVLWLAVLNYLVIVWTGTRSAMVTGAVLFGGWLVAEWLRPRQGTTVRQTIALALLVPALVATYLPFMASRMGGSPGRPDETVVFSVPDDERGLRLDLGSADPPGEGTDAAVQERGLRVTMTGRIAAWRHYYGLARENLWWGRGVGAGVVGGRGVLDRAFRLPHNEYLRLLVAGGFVGLGAMVLAYLWTLVELVRTVSRSRAALVVTAFLVVGLLALVSNVLANQAFIVPFWLYLAALRPSAG